MKATECSQRERTTPTTGAKCSIITRSDGSTAGCHLRSGICESVEHIAVLMHLEIEDTAQAVEAQSGWER
jgi:hypothetical protein